jgi:iron(III) transport system ATP-binding protein
MARAEPGTVFAEIREVEFAGAISTVTVRVLNSPELPDVAAIGSAPVILKKPGPNGLSAGDVVRLSIAAKAHVFV